MAEMGAAVTDFPVAIRPYQAAGILEIALNNTL